MSLINMVSKSKRLIDRLNKPRPKPKPKPTSTARERAIASRAVKPKAKTTTKKPTMKDVAGRTWRERFKERMDMGLPDTERQRRLSKIPGRRKQIRKKK